MEAGEYGLTRGTCFVGRRATVDFVVCFGCGGISFFFFEEKLFERTLLASSMRWPCLIYLSSSTGVRTGLHYLTSKSVCLCVYV